MTDWTFAEAKEAKFYERVGDVLTEAKLAQRMTTRSIAAAAGISAQSVSHALRGTRGISVWRFVLICAAMNLDPKAVMSSAMPAGAIKKGGAK